MTFMRIHTAILVLLAGGPECFGIYKKKKKTKKIVIVHGRVHNCPGGCVCGGPLFVWRRLCAAPFYLELDEAFAFFSGLSLGIRRKRCNKLLQLSDSNCVTLAVELRE